MNKYQKKIISKEKVGNVKKKGNGKFIGRKYA
jgi:hypothetical protein